MVSLPIIIPIDSEVLIKEGDKVTAGDVLARVQPGEEHTIHVAQLLKISAQKAAAVIRVQPGDHVNSGEVIAVRKNGLGLTSARLKSNVSGTVLRFDHENGILYVGNPSHEKVHEVVSPIAGVVSVCHNDQIVIQTNENIVQGTGGIGTTVRGQLVVVTDAQLTGSIIDKVVLVPALDRDSLIKAIGIGVGGIISPKIDPADLEYIQQKNLIVPIVIIHDDMVKTLLKQVNKEVFVEGSTFIILLLA